METNRVPHLGSEQAAESFECLTYLPSHPPETPGGTPFWILHLSVALSSQSTSRSILALPNQHPLTQYLTSDRQDTTKPSASICLILPLSSGYVARSDFLSRRLECCPLVQQAVSFVQPIAFVQGVPVCSKDELQQAGVLTKLAHCAVGAIHLHNGVTVDDIDRELQNRLSFSWLLADPIRPRRIAWVQGREDFQSIHRAFEAAAALGIKLVIMDESGHWMQGEGSPGAHLREAFVEVDITPDPGLSGRIVAAVRAYPEAIDGIMTISDVRLAAVAWASRELGLPTERPEAYDIASNKGRTRLLEEERRVQDRGGGKESFVLGSAEELEPFLEAQRGGNLLTFPRIVKPVVGWSSECVARVEDEKELVAAVRRASDRHAASPTPSTAVVVEPYVAGPEVDANLVVLDGEVLFCDISDDFPSEADQAGAGLWANFEETQNVMPSALPATEQVGIRDRLLRSVTGQGFRTGVFHCEARVRNSRCAYRTDQQGIVDLVPDSAASGIDANEQVDVYLHEINARPPGYLETVAVLLVYGVDYYALRLLTAIGGDETARIRALSQPFRDGPQFHLSLLMVHQALAGVMRSQDPVGEFLDSYPDVKANVVDFNSRKRGGDVLVGPGASDLCWVGFLSVVSRESRADLLRRVDHVAKTMTYEIETPDGAVVRARGLA
ncbi:ATP-grasp domain-containing protein [Podospora aff. communis PSN243]|uniref:ATP-grasp domain-containing protein n=1 Tax=Podospora aff. communis PSN243 TaxID=3040156 RepID=A0AAV9GKN1_9PEZI|nr:ATP-grasp domain-containing protein [Podospora aff. communis PSN243]